MNEFSIVQSIYINSYEPQQWPQTLNALCRFFHCSDSTLSVLVNNETKPRFYYCSDTHKDTTGAFSKCSTIPLDKNRYIQLKLIRLKENIDAQLSTKTIFDNICKHIRRSFKHSEASLFLYANTITQAAAPIGKDENCLYSQPNINHKANNQVDMLCCVYHLKPSEAKIILELCIGKSLKEISSVMHIPTNSLQKTISHIMRKNNFRNKQRFILDALRLLREV
ncbi:hypothetical protein [uncultured Pseudoteredinibacter sp.]|uniref:helix-turn-helix transcriptional regulator n=1 Tax=uncultured Pseudoteredinibacter sp. TaxID=1641701 RepID=UPI002617A812|nr:hypothetical protein [uncultured Pseudoteredinibacter sp.]